MGDDENLLNLEEEEPQRPINELPDSTLEDAIIPHYSPPPNVGSVARDEYGASAERQPWRGRTG